MELIAKIQNSGFLNKLLRSQALRRADRFKKQDPLEAQRTLFRKLIESAENTQFGMDNGFTRLKNISFEVAYRYYKNRVPIRSYQEFMTDYFYRDQLFSTMGKSAPNLNNVT